MTEKSSPQPAPTTGRTRIPVGTLISHDHGCYRWPACGNGADADPATEFDVSVSGDAVELKAPGFGGDPYRNGSILVKLKHWQQAWGTSAAAPIPSSEGAPSLREALELIAGTDPVDAALDPQRAVRVARAALAARPQPGTVQWCAKCGEGVIPGMCRRKDQPAPAEAHGLGEVALRRIGQWLTSEMNVAVRNGANSVSMPDELVEIAAWLAAPANVQPKGAAEPVNWGVLTWIDALHLKDLWWTCRLEGMELSEAQFVRIAQSLEVMRPAVTAQAPAPAQRTVPERITDAALKRAMGHPVVLEIMADCVSCADTENDAMSDPEFAVHDSAPYRLVEADLRCQAAAIRAQDPEIWPSLEFPSAAVAHATEYDQVLSEMDGTGCPRCLGSGSVPAMSNGGPDAHEIDVDCHHCGGTGSARDAYLKLAEFYSKANSELTQLRYYRWLNEQEKAKQAAKLEAAQQHAYAEGRKDEAESRQPGVEDYASGFRDGWIDCRRTMAGLVEPDSAVIAMSIRGNWKPSLGPDPDRPACQRCNGTGEVNEGDPEIGNAYFDCPACSQPPKPAFVVPVQPTGGANG